MVCICVSALKTSVNPKFADANKSAVSTLENRIRIFSDFDKLVFDRHLCLDAICDGASSFSFSSHHPGRICWQGKQPTGFAAGGKPGKNLSRSKAETLTILTFCLADSVKMPHLPQ